METSLPKNKTLSSALFLLYLIFLISLICSFRAVSSICIGAILLAGILRNKTEYKPLIQKNNINLFCIACFIFYGLQWFALLYSHDREAAWKDIQMKSALVFIPLAVCCTDYLNKNNVKKILDFFIPALAVACFYCLIMALINYSQYHHIGVFFYHTLVSLLSQHAVYFSILVFIALAILIENAGCRKFIFHKVFHWSLIIYFYFFIFLL
mgnify:FL=1